MDKPLTLDELKRLLQTVRDIEQNDPSQEIKVWIDAAELGKEEVRKVLASIKPGFPFWIE